MRTMVSIGLSILLLSAGAFANIGSKVTNPQQNFNVTVVHKNVAEPVLPPALSSCAVNRCVEI